MPEYPHVIFDLRHRLVEVFLRPGPAIGTVEFDEAHLVDIDAEDHVVSFEILALNDLKIDEMAEEFGFEAQLPAIHAALDRTLNPPTRNTTVTTHGTTWTIHATRAESVSPQVETDDSSEGPEIQPVIA